MNRIYRLVWNAALSLWVAVAEDAKGKSKGSPARGSVLVGQARAGAGAGFTLNTACLAALALCASLTMLTQQARAANAADASVKAGSAAISTVGNTTTINQNTQRAAIDWTALSTAAQEALVFNQPNASAIALNRITGSNPSELLGSLTANGQVFILNPNGVLFGAGSQVNVGGLVASTLSMSNADFMNGHHVFTGSGGSVVNQGTLNAGQGGYLALLAPEVRNEGVMTASLGTALLAAGNKVTLNLDNGSLLGYSIDQGSINALAENKYLIQANGGQVLLSAKALDALSSGVVNNTGLVEARTLNTSKGRIALEGDFVVQSGTLDASGTEGGRIDLKGRAILDAGTANASGTAGRGGDIAYRATQAIVQTAAADLKAGGATQGGTISLQGDESFFSSGSLSATGQRGGTIDALGNRVTLAAARLDASGSVHGGLIRVGGGFQGRDAGVMNAQTTFVNGATSLRANGPSGEIVVWSDGQTDYYGSASATGAGRIEVSGKGLLTYGGQADAGVGGTLLLDPANIIIDDTAGPAAFALTDPNPFAGKQFGANLTVLGTTTGGVFTASGKVVVASSTDNLGGTNAGAVYLFDTTTGALLSSLNGNANDQVGGTAITALSNGNYVVNSVAWNGNRGAVTWGSGSTGVSGVVSAANSLVGSTAGDQVGFGRVVGLTNGNYVVRSQNWDGTKGAVTWGSGTAGVAGAVSAANSLVGSAAGDAVGTGGLTALSNGNYVARSQNWGGNKGAVTWGNGATGTTGVVSAANSLVGSAAGDQVGTTGVSALANGNFVVSSANWNGGRGASTWVDGTTGATGVVSVANSLVGSNAGDQVGGNVIKELTNGNYVVNSTNWSSSSGAVTWASGSAGIAGVVSAANSLVGGNAGDIVGFGGITALSNGNYVVGSRNWDGARGAVTWGNGSTGVAGVVSAANSLVGANAGDAVGFGTLTALSNGNYVVLSQNWDGNKGAVTWGNGATGTTGVVSAANSLVGSVAGDTVGKQGIVALANGNYVVHSRDWNGTRGAVTWGSGTSGISGTVNAANSLVGSIAGDLVGGTITTALSNGNYVVTTSSWGGNRGAATWGDGTTGIAGTIDAGNSLVGSAAGDRVGGNGTWNLTNGNYVVASAGWDGTRGAATWGNGATGIRGTIDATNSLVGGAAGDLVGRSQVVALGNGNYVVRSSDWGGGKGAVTWGNGVTGVSGVASAANSLVGSTAGDAVGQDGLTVLANGNYVVRSTAWGGGKGALTWGSGNVGVTGEVGFGNSLLGTAAGEFTGAVVTAVGNSNYLVRSPAANGGRGQTRVGTPGDITFATGSAAGDTLRVNPQGIGATLAGGTAVTLQASNDITVNSNITVAGASGGALTLQAGRNINLNSVINTANGAFTASAGDATAPAAGRQAGAAGINFGAGAAINAGTGAVTLRVNGLPWQVPVQVPGPGAGTNPGGAVGGGGSGGDLMALYSTALQSMQAEQGENLLNPQRKRSSVGDASDGTSTRVEGCGVRMPVGLNPDDC